MTPLYNLSCNILTTTDNKDVGEISYDNVEKSIRGFHKQIQALLDSEYTEEDLETAKRTLKANLLETEGTPRKLLSLRSGVLSGKGADYYNRAFEIIDSITRDDIDNLSKKIFKNPPIYSILASKDTLNANKDFFASLENI